MGEEKSFFARRGNGRYKISSRRTGAWNIA
jgi:hypothetical protein